MGSKKVYFISDLHLGSRWKPSISQRDLYLIQFLESVFRDASHLFILGDLFEFWMEYRHYIPKKYFHVLAALGELSKKIEVHYFCGNHDFNPGLFFESQLNIQVHREPHFIELQGKRLLLLHGDGLAPSDWKYRILKKILVHPASNFCFKLIHPDMGMWLAYGVGKVSRDNPKKTQSGEYEKGAEALLRKSGADTIIHGHTHNAFIKNRPWGTYINSGEWLRQLNYLEMVNGEFEIKIFTPE